MDFMLPAGALYAPGAERIVPTIARLNRWAAEHAIPVVSTTDAHAENDPEFSQWPHTAWLAPPDSASLPRRCWVTRARSSSKSRRSSCFSNPGLPALLDCLGAERCVVYGVVTEYCVRLAALGLLQRGRQVEVVTDAIVGLDPEAAARTLDEIRQAGGRLTTVGEVCSA